MAVKGKGSQITASHYREEASLNAAHRPLPCKELFVLRNFNRRFAQCSLTIPRHTHEKQFTNSQSA
jgi:hypothetical protein